MYIEFYLLSDLAETFPENVIHFIRQSILQSVDARANRYEIVYRSKAVRRTLRLTFDNNSYYTLFVTTWQPPQVGQVHQWWFNYRIVETMKS